MLLDFDSAFAVILAKAGIHIDGVSSSEKNGKNAASGAVDGWIPALSGSDKLLGI